MLYTRKRVSQKATHLENNKVRFKKGISSSSSLFRTPVMFIDIKSIIIPL